MIFKQFYLNCLAHASYLIGDEQTRTAAVVDPQRDIDQYLSFADQAELRVAHVFLTHLHADFVAGHLELRDRVGATIHLGAAAKAEYAFTPLKDGDFVQFGRVRLKALETPGHTPESISIVVYDLDRSETTPYGVLTGDTLFVGDVGRPDLQAALGWTAGDLANLLYESLQSKLMTLPDESLVYPAHGAGSLCGKALSKETVSTIGDQRRVNYALQPMTRQAFVDLVTADQPDAPPYFIYDAVLNRQERPTLQEALARELTPKTLEEVLALQASGAQLLDTRDPIDFAAAHLKGTINIGLGGQYATWAGTVLSRERPIVIVADPGQESESAIRLGRIGFDHIVGYLQGGLGSLASRPNLVTTTGRVSASLAAERLLTREPSAPLAVDVRSPQERAQKHVAASVNIPLNHLIERFSELPKDRPLLVYCAGGYRSSIAASLLQQHGYTKVDEIAGGLAAWEAAQLPLVSEGTAH
ncbi:MAG: sulfurtransferase [Acidobacteria bacterium RIFCSPLOWO2_12_FULL_65_11]|nr:MAG: sulfurtransferase [Acidobacteria bacterium RIFCSPLOWO2_02_FULL_64_15]OFW30610.1 MAG: sulfurtransferase [Acidobacteria bacterium RIFCSPLOWO2_12_FULL_65_11]